MAESLAKKSSKGNSAERAQKRPAEHARQPTVSTSPYGEVLALQRSAGNRAVSQLLESGMGASPFSGAMLQRKCASCANSGSECAECRKKRTFALQPKLTINEPGDRYEQEADRIAAQVMAMPAQQTASSAPPHIQRFSGGAVGRPSVVPDSVHQTLASPGRPLESTLRQDMEQRFSYDFSRVRVHSGATAEQSARDVSARAYTVGQDIVFGTGRFAPAIHEGRKLIAHELTHVVQQSGAAGIRPDQSDKKRGLSPISTPNSTRHLLARKAEVDLPGWGSPLLGHDDSDVTFTPSGKFATMGHMAAQAKDRTFSQIAEEMSRAVASGQVDYSDMKEDKGYHGTLRIKAGSKGTVEISVKAHFFFDQKTNDTYDQEFVCSWSVEADLKGKLRIGDPRPQITPIGDEEAPFQLAALNPDQDQDFGSVQISPQFNSSQFTDIPNVNIGGSIDVKKVKGGVSGGVTFGNERTFPPGVLVRTFSLDLRVIDIPPPEVKMIIGPIETLRSFPVTFPPPKNRKGQDTVPSAQQRGLISWYQGLNSRTKEQIEAGTTPISLEGHASTTGDPAMNLDLSSRRVEHVKRILSMFAGNRAVFTYRAVGEYKAKTADNIESEEERTVVVSVWE
jgi:hypothetical protein